MRVYLTLFLLTALLISSCSSDPDTHRLTTSVVPSEAGTVTPDDGEFAVNRELEISAIPNEDWVFDRWEGDYTGTQNPVVIEMDSDKDIAAIFTERNYTLTVNTEGEGTVSERVVQQKSTDYPSGTVVELTAEPANNWQFVEWQGDLQGSENPENITIEEEVEVTAVFEPVSYPLTINIDGEGTVEENVIQAKSTDYPFGTTVELTAIPDSAWAFIEWEDDIESTESTVEITIDEPKTVTVVFDRTFGLTTVAIPEDGGTIEPSEGEFIRDTSFEVEAIANEGWRFVEWRGDFSGTTNPFNLTMNGNKTLEAHFDRADFTLDTTTVGMGEILLDVLVGQETETGYEFDSVVEVTAVAAEGWEFAEWQGDLSGTANPNTITIDGNKSITAVFRFFDGGDGTVENPYQISRIDQLQAMVQDPEAHYILVDNIDASETGTGEGFNPVGVNAIPFTGSLDGDGFEITNLTINRPDEQYVGLFGVIGDGATVENVYIESADVTGENEVGILAGSNNGDILNSYTTGTVNGLSNDVGGLVGRNNGLIQQSFSLAVTNGSNNIGGLVGNNSDTILSAYALGNVDGNDRVGGLVGLNVDEEGTVFETYAAGEVTGSSITSVVGGLIGVNSGSTNTSYWDTLNSGQASGSGSGSTTGMTGLTTAQMTGPSAETNMTNFDWEEIWVTTSTGYPTFQWLVD
ncbi:MAG: hypothetical protein RI575_04110 [Balneolaceae bacterium]|nr:hypothetical protein [Balneolaceae bacterium]MDR9407501.1 hypothetical protein [Balneolaceae bacterium]